jgi:DNA-binding MarR family transcriptional regulator
MDRRWILLARTVVILHRALERFSQSSALTIPQYRFLLTLKRETKRASVLAAMSGIGRPAASALVTGLTKRGMIERITDPDDGRAEMLRLTEAGLAEYAAFEQALAGDLAAHLAVDDVESLLDRVEELALFIDRLGPPAHPV